MEQKRLDIALVERGLAPSRENAKRLIEAGKVTVDGKIQTKPSKSVSEACVITAEAERYVSRGGYKLEKALDTFGISVEGKSFMDCGASTGGFTDCLLQHGASNIWAIDVGTAQLSSKLAEYSNVVSIENVNLRYIDKQPWMASLDGVVMDVSFISAKLILERLFKTIDSNPYYIVLVKPQFEAGKENLNKHGVVTDKAVHCDVLRKMSDFAQANGYIVQGLTYSPIKGGDGNIEYLIYFDKSEKNVYNISNKKIEAVVQQAFDVLRKESE